MAELGSLGIIDLLVEGGPTLASRLWSAGLVDRFVVYLEAGSPVAWVAPPSTGLTTLADARPIRINSVTRVGPDIMASSP